MTILTAERRAAIEAAAKSADEEQRTGLAEELDTAIAYSKGDMYGDVEKELQQRYESSMTGKYSRRIAVVSQALTQQYVNEMATAYSGAVSRKLVDMSVDGGEVKSEPTERLNKALSDIGYDQVMHDVEKTSILLRSCCTDHGAEGGKLDVEVWVPQDVLPVPPENGHINRANQDSYLGYVLDLRSAVRTYDFAGDPASRNQYAAVFPDGQVTYHGQGPGDIEEPRQEKNPLRWPQPVLDEQGRPTGKTEDRPPQKITVWHEEKPTGVLIPRFIPTMLYTNRALNLLWSMMLDVIRFQGGGTPAHSTNNPGEATDTPVGVRWPVSLQLGEDFGYRNSANDYGGIGDFIQLFMRLLGKGEGLSPADFSAEVENLQSGLSKIIANLPKSRMRKKRTKWFATLERTLVWPKIGSTLVWLGALDSSVQGLTLVTDFRGDTMPLSVPDRIAEENQDLATGLTTPAKILSDRTGMDVAAAQKIIDENTGKDEGGTPSLADARIGVLDKVMNIVTAAGKGEIPRGTALSLLQTLAGLEAEQAEAILADMPDRFAEAAEEKAAEEKEKAEQAKLLQEQAQPPEKPEEAPPGKGEEPPEEKRPGLLARMAGLGKKKVTDD